MIAHLSAIKAAAGTTGFPVFVLQVTGSPAYPYVLLEVGVGALALERDVTGTTEDIDEVVRVKLVGTTAEHALTHLPALRTALAAPLEVPGRRVWFTREGGQMYLDRDATVPNTNRHPAIAMDEYRLQSVAL